MRRILLCAAFLLFLNFFQSHLVFAEDSTTVQRIEQSLVTVDSMIKSVKENDLDEANIGFQKFKEQWLQMKGEIRKGSLSTYEKIETKIAGISIALLNQDPQKAEESLQFLKSYFSQYINEQVNAEQTINLSTYITLLKATKESLSSGDIAKGKVQVEQLKSQWLNVEGDVVGQSKAAYNNSEQRLVLLTSYVNESDTLSKAEKLIDQMIEDLSPLAESSYGILDAAFIPIREGLEALLVVGALLSITKKEEGRKGSYLIWSGTCVGILTSLGIGFLVNSILSSTSFGKNNFFINGLSGVIASMMLLYVTHWLHRSSHIKNWNNFINEKTEKALHKGKVFSLALLAFLAVLREGVETVIFLIGMANQMSWTQLLAGIILGFGILVILGVLLLKLSIRLPLKPFFFISSIIVFYLCLKFMGSGIHSLQLAGIIPSTVSEMIPTIQALGVYPSWYSTLPQLIIIALSMFIILLQQRKQSKVN